MTDNQFKEKIYGPYLEAWKIIKILQHAYSKPELFISYMDEVQKFADAYAGNEFAELIRKQILHQADNVIAKMEALHDKTH